MLTRTLLILSMLAALASAQLNPQRLDEQAQAYFDAGKFNGTVLVAKDGRPVLSKGYGMANFEWNIPNTPDTKFRLGSITKQFTAMTLLLLEQQGKLKLTDPVCKYVDPCPETWKPITLHQVVTHTAGIPNFTAFPDYASTMMLKSPPAESLKKFRDKPLDFDPGTKFNYSNSGFVLLGYIIEKVAGEPYEDYLRKNVLDPLGMKDTGYDDAATVLPKRAAGYVNGKTLANAAFIDMSIPHAAGSLYSTTLDLMKWDAAQSAGKLLTPENYQRYYTPLKNDYAYGLNVQTKNGVQQISHGGGINGFATMIIRVPSERLLVVTLSNVLPSDAGKLADNLINLSLGKEVEKPTKIVEIPMSADKLKQYVGEYELSPTFILTITLEDGQLITQATGQGKVPVFAKAEDIFFPKIMEAELIFEKDATGKVTGLTLSQGGRRTPAKKR
jgi:CubicO group peptidase (beta-lactamase class C family)